MYRGLSIVSRPAYTTTAARTTLLQQRTTVPITSSLLGTFQTSKRPLLQPHACSNYHSLEQLINPLQRYSQRQTHDSHSQPLFISGKNVPMERCFPQKQLLLIQQLQTRGYLFFPTSWTELKIRLREASQARIVKVKLWRQRNREARHRAYKVGYNYYQRKMRQARERGRTFRDRGFAWMKAAMQRTQRRGSNLWQRAKRGGRRIMMMQQLQRADDSALEPTTIPVPITEYSQQSWFDKAGRPLTSRDETGRFVNPWMSRSTDGVHTFETLIRWRYGRLQREWKQYGWNLFRPSFLKDSSPQFASAALTDVSAEHALPEPLRDSSLLRCTWIGHATCWIQKGSSLNILTDPHFSNRASPVQNLPIGVARDVPPAFSLDQLLDHVDKFDACLISHDHYDHLDRSSVMELRNKVDIWVVPLGIGTWLEQKAGICAKRIVELAWWDSVLLCRRKNPEPNAKKGRWFVEKRHSLQDQEGTWCRHPSLEQPSTADQIWITALPTQHWSSRTFFDRCYRLWAAFAVFLDHNQVFYFTGDTGFPTEFPLFEQAADYIGQPVDLAAIPIGAYAPRFLNKEAHLDPNEAVQLHQKLQCRQSIAIHHMSFPLGEEPPHEPARLLEAAATEASARFDVVPHGGSVTVGGG